ncbi:envelope stress response membrane protein PspB [Gammaproteobacteria bacterium AB-CW1]|uniref:Envelope stress response membrane protein PspB n=1 Tax=Natronospira elongata TaxID=3110268 RepID=A0AAP6JEI6_9GAMM|nr:envelope stress response membrane protein PspB [Gammaproteobacteria bacterium AB-CW1]
MSEHIVALLIIFMVIVLPLWLLLHYITRWKQTRGLSGEDERSLVELWELADRMEERLHTLEEIIDDREPPRGRRS